MIRGSESSAPRVGDARTGQEASLGAAGAVGTARVSGIRTNAATRSASARPAAARGGDEGPSLLAHPPMTGPKHHSEPDPRPDPPHPLRAVAPVRHVGDRGLASGNIPGRRSGEDPGDEEEREEVPLDRDREEDHRRRVPRQREEDHGPPAEAVRDAAEDRRGDELRERKRSEEEADRLRGPPHRLHVEREERDDDPEPNEIEEDGDEDDEDDARLARIARRDPRLERRRVRSPRPTRRRRRAAGASALQCRPEALYRVTAGGR